MPTFGYLTDFLLNRAFKEESAPGKRGDNLDEVCDDVTGPVIAFVGADNNYGGKDPEYEQTPLAKVTPEITNAIKMMKAGKMDD